ncbi:GNAT family N-acetyltransferase [Bradyrhizobium diazoefficiens]|uniref:GNAT family N-acetyltransferase n=1 Tax=Bradyrhizobium diazoefficiens TaxID=1355477 RepID=A0A810BBY4_9BRAD|nr:GNAT family N-acetyltransferase [Bradyrhizobium diazoefficiens]
MMNLKIERAFKTDLPFVMMTERSEGYHTLVGRWDEARHLAAIDDNHYAYFIARDCAASVGFAIVRDWGALERVTCLKRIAVSNPGKELGRRIVRAVVGTVFRETEAHRVWLSVFPENERARRAYEAVGFKAEGIARGSAYFGGIHRDELIMAVLRTEWTAV